MATVLALIASLSSAAIGWKYGGRARSNPQYFWRYLLIGCLAMTPLAIGGYTWYEEIFAGSYLLANLPIKILKSNKIYHVIFVVFILYFIMQGFRGMINFLEYGQAMDSLRKIRWPIFFLILLGLFYKINNIKLRNLIDEDLAYKVTVFGLVFHIIYIFWGIVSLIKTGSVAYTQNAMLYYAETYGYMASIFLAIWTPTAYVGSILTIVVPAVLITIRESAYNRVKIAWITLCIIGISVFFFDTRSGSLAFFSLIVFFFPKLGFRKKSIMLALGIITVFAFSFISKIGAGKGVEYYFSDLKRTLRIENKEKYDISSQDIERQIWARSAYYALSEQPENLLFGYGFRLSGYIVAPYVYDMFTYYNRSKRYVENVSTEAITNLAVDGGVVGLTLLVLLFVYTGREIYRQGSKYRLLLIVSLGLTFGWLFIINVIDSYILFLTVMPSGIFTQLSKINFQLEIK